MADKFQLKALITGVDKLSPMLAGMRKNVAQFRKQLKTSSLGDKISFGEVMKGGAIAAPFMLGAKAAIDFESAMADVKKVVNFDTPEQFKQMGDDVLNLSRRLPMAAKDIAAIVAAGGQAGFDKSELARFAEDAVKMGVAFDQSADESGTMMAKWRTSFKMGQDQVVELADKINYLGNNGPATAKQISSIVTRIGPLGQVAGLASGQIAAMGATLAGMGIQEEVAATGMKNFMLALTSGSSATKQQQNAFKSLRLDAKQLAVGMQKDAQGTLLRVLTAVGKVDKSKQASVLQQLFGKESIEAIAPLLTNMELLRGNLQKVAEEQQYGGSMQQEYAARAATTANNIQLFTNRVVGLGVSMGNILLPSINSFLGVIGPMTDQIAGLTAANPWLVKGLLGAALGFGALRLAVWGATVATKLFLAVSNLSPIGIAVRALALGAGFLIANWSAVAPWFKDMWGKIQPYFAAGWELIKTIWSYSALGMVVANWEPIVDWFKRMWERIRPYVEPIIDATKWVGNKIGGLLDGGPARNATPDASGLVPLPSGGGRGLAGAVAWQQQSIVGAGAGGARLNGELTVKFDNAPPGTRVDDAKTNQSGLTVTSRVGRRSLGDTN
ncbi:phage tail protein [Pandoraea eparura]|uniref:Phage tail protein n=1 Tax=Pandoraea eparura TaxID=2508291 RepID=A0A5E4SPC4_9BURK|nr:phage tail tape measure protein [Pandoraea eparura]VVD76248.1 phage tail protein [Pandoraea eparura]